MLIREQYLKRIRPFYDFDLVKVIVGIRKCGKSVILNQIMNEIKKSNNSLFGYANFFRGTHLYQNGSALPRNLL